MADDKAKPLDPEAVILHRLHSGDRAAVVEIYGMYFDRLYSLVFNQVGGCRDIAEDIIEGTFLAAVKSAETSRGWGSVYTWLCSIAYRRVSEYYRGQSKESKGSVDSSDVGVINVGDDSGRETKPKNPGNPRLTHHAIGLALEQMSWEYRQVLILYYVEEMSVEEISQITNYTPKAIDGILAWCRRVLQHHLKESERGEHA